LRRYRGRGGKRERLLWQIMADVYNKRILRPSLLEEATSLGTVIVGGIGGGIFKGRRKK